MEKQTRPQDKSSVNMLHFLLTSYEPLDSSGSFVAVYALAVYAFWCCMLVRASLLPKEGVVGSFVTANVSKSIGCRYECAAFTQCCSGRLLLARDILFRIGLKETYLFNI